MVHAIEQRISSIIDSTVSNLGFEVVKISLQGSHSNVIEILIDRLDGEKVSIEDCTLVSRNISTLLDVEDIITDKYFLEVASCGIERPLVKFKDYVRFLHSEIKLELKLLINQRSRYRGVIVEARDEVIHLKVGEETIVINFEEIKNARKVLTEEMFRQILKVSAKGS